MIAEITGIEDIQACAGLLAEIAQGRGAYADILDAYTLFMPDVLASHYVNNEMGHDQVLNALRMHETELYVEVVMNYQPEKDRNQPELHATLKEAMFRLGIKHGIYVGEGEWDESLASIPMVFYGSGVADEDWEGGERDIDTRLLTVARVLDIVSIAGEDDDKDETPFFDYDRMDGLILRNALVELEETRSEVLKDLEWMIGWVYGTTGNTLIDHSWSGFFDMGYTEADWEAVDVMGEIQREADELWPHIDASLRRIQNDHPIRYYLRNAVAAIQAGGGSEDVKRIFRRYYEYAERPAQTRNHRLRKRRHPAQVCGQRLNDRVSGRSNRHGRGASEKPKTARVHHRVSTPRQSGRHAAGPDTNRHQLPKTTNHGNLAGRRERRRASRAHARSHHG